MDALLLCRGLSPGVDLWPSIQRVLRRIGARERRRRRLRDRTSDAVLEIPDRRGRPAAYLLRLDGWIGKACRLLTKRERFALVRRYLHEEHDDVIARHLKCAADRVRKFRHVAMRKIRDAVRSGRLPPPPEEDDGPPD